MTNVVFDFGNTLKVENPRIVDLSVVKKALKSLGYQNDIFLKYYKKVSQLFKECSKSNIQQITAFEIFLDILEDKREAHKIVDSVSNKLSIKFKWKTDARQSILALKNKNFKVYLLSNTIWNSTVYLNNNIEFFSLFDNVYFSDKTGERKPNISAFKKVITGGSSNYTYDYWMVGDSYFNDIIPAQKLGMHTIQIVNHEVPRLKSKDGIFKVGTLTDAIHVILEEKRYETIY